MKTLSIVIPVYNGANSIERLVRELAALNEDDWELILVNDCSPDDSWAIIERLAKEAPMSIIAVDLARNFGEHNAVMAGYAVSTGNHVINIDDDFQNPPSEVIKLLKYAQDNPGFDVVYTKYKRKQHNFLRNLGSRFNDRVASFLLDKPRGLYLSSFRCVNRFLCDGILEYGGPYPYIDGIILERTQRIGTLFVVHAPRVEGRSSYSFRKLVRLWLFMFVNFSVMPLRISSIMGFAISGAGFLLALVVVFESLVHGTPQGWPSIAAGILVFAGIQLIMLGLIGEYLGRLYLMQKGKPQFVVRTKVSGV